VHWIILKKDNLSSKSTIREDMGMFLHGHFLFGAGWLLFTILGRLFWLALIIVGVLLLVNFVRSRSQARVAYPFYQAPHQPQGAPQGQTGQQLSAMEILRQRYARGEIDAVAFDQMRERLQGPEMVQQQ
jgi:putative membrane protein